MRLYTQVNYSKLALTYVKCVLRHTEGSLTLMNSNASQFPFVCVC